MILVDTSIWIDILKDKTGILVEKFRERTDRDIIVFSRFVQLELLQGSKNEFEWTNLNDYLKTQYYLETIEGTWSQAAKIYYDLRKSGITIRSTIDCCIAQIAIENQALLLHKDRDFSKIAEIRPLENDFFLF